MNDGLLCNKIILKSGLEMPTPGFGTWHIGEAYTDHSQEAKAIRYTFDSGFRHFDTAEMYGDGGSEIVIGNALSDIQRSDYFLTSKFYPHHARHEQMIKACENSLKRLQTDYLDLYLLHWPGNTPFEEILLGADRLLKNGKIRAFGVSNFDTSLLGQIIEHGFNEMIDVNQVMYNPARRGIEFDLLPLMQMQNIACVAYTPLEPDTINRNPDFSKIAESLNITPVQLAFAWHLNQNTVCPIPKSATIKNIDALVAASHFKLDEEHLLAINNAFPSPTSAEPLDII